MGIPVGREHLEDSTLDVENRNIESAAAEIVNRDASLGHLVEPVGQRCGGGLIDEPHNFEPGEPAGVLGRLALPVVEVRRYGDYDALDLLVAKRTLGAKLQRL